VNLRYELARLRADYYLSGVGEAYRRARPVPPPRYVVWDATRRCNLHCSHCGAAGGAHGTQLDTAQVGAVLDQLAAMKVEMFGVTGGEPLLRPDLLPLLAYAGERGLRTGIATNGFLVDTEMVARTVQAGVYSVQVSLDGHETLHNSIRGHDESYQRAVAAVRYLLEARVPIVSVATTVTGRTLPELGVLHGILAGLGVRLWRLAPVMPIGRALDSRDWLSAPQLRSMLEFVREHRSPGLHLYVGENLPYLGRWETRVRDRPLVCPVGFTACCLGIDGGIRGCPEQADTADNREGSVLETPFAEIWQRGFRRYRTRAILAEDSACVHCPHRSPCYGGCWVMRAEKQHCVRSALGR
jgi:radical SAM protein with 4Fe4S-binding SPASM domain